MHHYEADSLVTRKTVHQSGKARRDFLERHPLFPVRKGNEPEVAGGEHYDVGRLDFLLLVAVRRLVVRAERYDAFFHATAHGSLDQSGRARVLLDCRVKGKVEITPILDRVLGARNLMI